MSRHLSEDEISAVVAGGPGPESAPHLQTCAHCRQQVDRFENVLGHFRGTVRDWSGAQFPGHVEVQPRTHFWPALAYGWALALIVLLSFGGYRFSTRPRLDAAISSSVPQSDTLLLKQVNADVSRSVPPGMETLLGFTTTETEQR